MARSGRHADDNEYDRERTPLQHARIDEVTSKMERTAISQPRNREVRFVETEPHHDFENEQAELYYIDDRQDYGYRPPYNNGYNARPDLGRTPNWRPQSSSSGQYRPPPPQNRSYAIPTGNHPDRPLNEPTGDPGSGMAEIKRMVQKVIDTQIADRDDINRRIGGIVSTFGGKIDALTGKFNGLEAHVKILEKEITMIIATNSKVEGKRALPGQPEENPKDFAQFFREVQAPPQEEPPVATVIDEPDMINLQVINSRTRNMPEQIAEILRASELRRKISRVLETMEGTIEVKYLLESNPRFMKLYEYLEWARYVGRMRAYAEGPQDHPFSAERPSKRTLEVANISTPSYRVRRQVDNSAASAIARNEGLEEQSHDPGPFTIPCIIGDLPFLECVLDTGASKSIMPLCICKAIGIARLKRATTILQLADWSTSSPVGIAEKVSVLFKGYAIPTDFLVVDTGNEQYSKIILGRPFLHSTKAVMNVCEGFVDFTISEGDDIRRVWRNPKFEMDGEPFNLAISEFFCDLVEHANEITVNSRQLFGLPPTDQVPEEFDIPSLPTWLPSSPLHRTNRRQTTGRTRDEAGPSRRRPRVEWQNLVGNDETNYNTLDGEEESPSEQELDPGDIPSTTPGHAPSS